MSNCLIDELLPCPFCGGDPEIERKGTSRASMIIACTNCGCPSVNKSGLCLCAGCGQMGFGNDFACNCASANGLPAHPTAELVEQAISAIIASENSPVTMLRWKARKLAEAALSVLTPRTRP